jgi:O-antigen chain-terminating methyltransferase
LPRGSAGAIARSDSLAAAHEELRVSIGVLQQAAQNLKREITKIADSGLRTSTSQTAPVATGAVDQAAALDSHKYVGFEDQFRGSPDDIRRRVAEYVPIFAGARDVLDVGCGRGEFLSLLTQEEISARGYRHQQRDGRSLPAERSRGQRGRRAHLSCARSPDGSLGGLFAAQVIEHLEPRYLTALLDAAFDKLRPGAPIVLETINPACWFAFFESYIRDITHVRPIHPDTLKYPAHRQRLPARRDPLPRALSGA